MLFTAYCRNVIVFLLTSNKLLIVNVDEWGIEEDVDYSINPVHHSVRRKSDVSISLVDQPSPSSINKTNEDASPSSSSASATGSNPSTAISPRLLRHDSIMIRTSKGVAVNTLDPLLPLVKSGRRLLLAQTVKVDQQRCVLLLFQDLWMILMV